MRTAIFAKFTTSSVALLISGGFLVNAQNYDYPEARSERDRTTRDTEEEQRGQRNVRRAMAASAGEIAGQPARFYGRNVRVSAEVEEVFGKGVFTLDEDRWFAGPDVLVVAPGGIRAPQEDTRVTVTGTVREFNSPEIYRDYDWYGPGWYGYDWGYHGDVWLTWNRRPVIMASSIRNEEGRELVLQRTEQKPGRAQRGTRQLYQASAGDLAAQPKAYDGHLVSVRSEINERFNPHVFTLDEDRLFAGPDVLVVVPRPAASPEEGATVNVIGTVRLYDRNNFEQEYQWFGDAPEAGNDWLEDWGDELRPVVIARSVRTERGRELVQGPGTERIAAGAPGTDSAITGGQQRNSQDITSLDMINRALGPLDLLGHRVELEGVKVHRVLSPTVVLIGEEDAKEVLVRTPRAQRDLQAGNVVSVFGVIERTPRTVAEWDLEEDQLQTARQRPIYIRASRVQQHK